LEAALAEAIKTQRYEDAAGLRDRLRRIQSSEAPDAAGDRHAAS